MEDSAWLAEVVMEPKDNVVSFPKGESGHDDGVGNRSGNGNGDHGERLARLEVHLQHLKENSATKEHIATLNGKLDTVAQAIKNLVTKDDLQADRRRLTKTIIAAAMLLFVGLAAVVALLGYIDAARPESAEPSRFPAPRSEQAVPPPATPGSGGSLTSQTLSAIGPILGPS